MRPTVERTVQTCRCTSCRKTIARMEKGERMCELHGCGKPATIDIETYSDGSHQYCADHKPKPIAGGTTVTFYPEMLRHALVAVAACADDDKATLLHGIHLDVSWQPTKEVIGDDEPAVTDESLPCLRLRATNGMVIGEWILYPDRTDRGMSICLPHDGITVTAKWAKHLAGTIPLNRPVYLGLDVTDKDITARTPKGTWTDDLLIGNYPETDSVWARRRDNDGVATIGVQAAYLGLVKPVMFDGNKRCVTRMERIGGGIALTAVAAGCPMRVVRKALFVMPIALPETLK